LRVVQPALLQATEHGVDGDIVRLALETALRRIGGGIEATEVHMQQRPPRQHLGMVRIEFLGSHKRRLGSPEVERVKAQARISREIGGVVPPSHQIIRETLHRIGHAAELERRS
jgi:hypothetical protein